MQVIHNVPYLSERKCRVSKKRYRNDLIFDAIPGPVHTDQDSDSEPGEHRGYQGIHRDLKEEAKSISHLMTHLPFNKHCVACQRAKMENVKCHRGAGNEGHETESFGDLVTADMLVLHGLKNYGFHLYFTIFTQSGCNVSLRKIDTSIALCLAFASLLGQRTR